MFDSLGNRMKAYEKISDIELMKRIPLVIRCDGRNFSRLTRKLPKPYDPILLEVMAETMFFVASEIQGCCFAYTQSDEITFVLRNDQSLDAEPWYGNRIQKIVSVTAGLATCGFNKIINESGTKLDLIGDALFDARAFGMPTLGEVVNNLIWRQQDCTRNAVSNAAQTLLARKFGKKSTLKLLHKLSVKERIELLQTECGIDFNQEFPNSFRLGVGAYKVPVIVLSSSGEEMTRKKWTIDWDLPNFVVARDFIYNLVFSGADVFRKESFGEKHENS